MRNSKRPPSRGEQSRDPKRPAGRPSQPGGRGAARLQQGTDRVLIWGFHAVREALASTHRTVLRAFATAPAAERLASAFEARNLTPTLLGPEEIDGLAPREAVHQGVLLEARPLEAWDIADIPDQGLVVVLDQVTDPHNVGAILRTAAAFGVSALVTTERHAPEMTGVLAKAASGGLEHVPVVHVVNLARALDQLSKRGFQVIGLDSDGAITLAEASPGEAVAFVLGAEGKGLRRLTRERCEVVARLDMPGPIKSLNVSNACAVALATLTRFKV